MLQNNKGSNIGLFLLGLCIAAGLVLSTITGGKILRQMRALDQKITVKGYAEINLISDTGIITGTLEVNQQDLTLAMKKIRQDKEDVSQYLRSQEIDEKAFDFGAPNIITINKMDKGQFTNKLDYYTVSLPIRIELNDVKKIKDLNTKMSNDLIEKGMYYHPHPPQYFFSGLGEIKLDLLGHAVENAKERAEVIARAGGSNVGEISHVRQGIFQITPRLSTDVSSGGINDTSYIDKTAKIVVSADFSLKK